MQIHLSDISSCEGNCVQVTAPLEMDCITFQMGSLSVHDKEPLELTITNTGKKVLELVGTGGITVSIPCDTGKKVLELVGTGGITVSIPCDRCLEDVSVEIPLSFKRKLDMKLTEEERVNDLDENAYLTGMDLDVDQLVYFEVLMNWPLKVLCKEDCKGICSQCRVNDLDENAYLTGMDLDVDQLVYFEVLMNWPLKVLCKEDCKGICSQCGKNLNEGLCDCVEEPKDPRMAAISDIFSKFKEV